jgi:N-acetylglutamate synthase-like GNAT family acetyltransferase
MYISHNLHAMYTSPTTVNRIPRSLNFNFFKYLTDLQLKYKNIKNEQIEEFDINYNIDNINDKICIFFQKNDIKNLIHSIVKKLKDYQSSVYDYEILESFLKDCIIMNLNEVFIVETTNVNFAVKCVFKEIQKKDIPNDFKVFDSLNQSNCVAFNFIPNENQMQSSVFPIASQKEGIQQNLTQTQQNQSKPIIVPSAPNKKIRIIQNYQEDANNLNQTQVIQTNFTPTQQDQLSQSQKLPSQSQF